MSSQLRLGSAAIVCLFAAASVVPADAQQRRGSASGARTGAVAAPRSAPAPRGQAAAPRPAQAPGRSGGARPAPPPGGSRPATGPATGRAVPRPAYRPGSGYGGYYPGYGYRGHYPYYGYGGYYGGYYPGFYWGLGAYFGPYYYSPWLYSAYWGYPGYYPYAYWYDYGPGGASLKVGVEPKTAEVFVDGYLAGIVDQFDGMFQSLSVEPGEHEVTIYQEGFKSIRQRLYLSAGSTMRVKGALEKLAPGEPNEPRPQPAAAQYETQVQTAPLYGAPQPQGAPPDRQAPEQYAPAAGDSRFGQVAIRVQPGDAEVLIDGEPWRNPAGADRLVVHRAAGTHRVEIRKDGFDPFVTAVEIRRGETTVLNVSLARF